MLSSMREGKRKGSRLKTREVQYNKSGNGPSKLPILEKGKAKQAKPQHPSHASNVKKSGNCFANLTVQSNISDQIRTYTADKTLKLDRDGMHTVLRKIERDRVIE